MALAARRLAARGRGGRPAHPAPALPQTTAAVAALLPAVAEAVSASAAAAVPARACTAANLTRATSALRSGGSLESRVQREVHERANKCGKGPGVCLPNLLARLFSKGAGRAQLIHGSSRELRTKRSGGPGQVACDIVKPTQ